MKSRRAAVLVVPWVLLACLVFVTVVPIELRPSVGRPTIERFVALAAVGFAFGLAYPRRIVLVASLVVAATIGLEATQLVLPTRHGREYDLAVKLVGATLGLTCGWLAAALASSRRWLH